MEHKISNLPTTVVGPCMSALNTQKKEGVRQHKNQRKFTETLGLVLHNDIIRQEEADTTRPYS